MAIQKDALEKSLAKLETLARSQLYHTSSDSNPGEWAGTAPQDEDSMKDMIDDNGTDYDGVKKALVAKAAKGFQLTKAEAAILSGSNPMKAISKKIAKGQKLTAAESWCLKAYKAGGFVKSDEKPSEAGAPGEAAGANEAVATHAASEEGEDDTHEEISMSKGQEDDDEDEDDKKMDKSLSDYASTSKSIQSGIELSPFLSEFVHAMDLALKGNEKRMAKSIAKALTPVFSRVEALEKSHSKATASSTEFNKGLAEAVIGIAQQVSGTADLASHVASAPVRGPKSQLRALPAGVTPIQKSFEGSNGASDFSDPLIKSQTLEVMLELVKAGKLNPVVAVKYDTTGEISPQVQQLVSAAIGGLR